MKRTTSTCATRRSPEAVAKHGGRAVALGRLGEALDLHPLREGGTQNYLWWTYERLEDLRPLLGA